MRKEIKYIIFIIIGLFIICFLFRTTELSITYDGIEESSSVGSYAKVMNKTISGNINSVMSTANMLDSSSVYEEEVENFYTPERYRENIYYRVDSEKFDKLTERIQQVANEYNAVIKINEQKSNKRKEYDREFYPRYQILEFTIDNTVEDVSKIEEILKLYGNIRNSNTSKTSIEQEIQNKKDRLKEIEAARKALQESKDKDWIARQDSNYAKESERLKNQILNAEKEATYKTYTIDIYEVIKFNVNSIKYWYKNNWELKNAISNSLPDMIRLFAILIPITLVLIIFTTIFFKLFRNNKENTFKKKLEMIQNMELESEKEIHFDVKL